MNTVVFSNSTGILKISNIKTTWQTKTGYMGPKASQMIKIPVTRRESKDLEVKRTVDVVSASAIFVVIHGNNRSETIETVETI